MNEYVSEIEYIRGLESALGLQRKKFKNLGRQAIRGNGLEPDLEHKRGGGIGVEGFPGRVTAQIR